MSYVTPGSRSPGINAMFSIAVAWCAVWATLGGVTHGGREKPANAQGDLLQQDTTTTALDDIEAGLGEGLWFCRGSGRPTRQYMPGRDTLHRGVFTIHLVM